MEKICLRGAFDLRVRRKPQALRMNFEGWQFRLNILDKSEEC